MKKAIHPEWHSEAKVISNGKVIMEVGSTSPELQVEIWSGNHPFYTGKEMLVDTDNLVEKFNNKLAAAQKITRKIKSKKTKRLNRSTERSSVGTQELTLKDMLKGIQ